MKLHIDDQVASEIACNIIKKDSKYVLKEYNELLNKAELTNLMNYEQQDLATNLIVLKAMKVLYEYYSGETLDFEL